MQEAKTGSNSNDFQSISFNSAYSDSCSKSNKIDSNKIDSNKIDTESLLDPNEGLCDLWWLFHSSPQISVFNETSKNKTMYFCCNLCSICYECKYKCKCNCFIQDLGCCCILFSFQ